MVIADHIILWATIGGIAGFVQGIAGVGGGAISIPLFIILGGYDIKDASGYGLLVLMVSAFISWLIQRKNTQYPITAVLILFSVIVAFISAPLKLISPTWLIITFLNVTFIFSLYSLWVLRKPDDPGEERPLSYRLKTASIGGMITGFLSTMTGLGGGVVIVPWLTGITRLNFEQAMACSLITIAISAPFSAWRQDRFNLSLSEWLALIIGVLMMALLVQKITSYIPHHRMLIIRKLTLTGVILLSMIRTLAELFY